MDAVKIMTASDLAHAKQNLTDQISQIYKSGLAKEEIKNQESELKKQLAGLESMQVATVQLAIQPTQKMITEIYGWAKNKLGEGWVIDFEVAPSILGGLIIEYQGKYHDRSLINVYKKYIGVN